MRTLAMFPLGTVLLPGEPLPLQVFEPRYVAMLHDIAQDRLDAEFGVVLIERGSEVGGADERTDVGTTARIVQLGALPGGRYGLQCVGGERFRVLQWLPDDPYPRAEVEPWPDGPESPDAATTSTVQELLVELYSVAGELARSRGLPPPPSDPLTGLPDDPSARSFALAARAGLTDTDRQSVLAAPDPARRTDVLAEALQDRIAALRFAQLP